MRVAFYSPYANLQLEEVQYVACDTLLGRMGVLPHHADLVGVIALGSTVRCDTSQGSQLFQVEEGVVVVESDQVQFVVAGFRQVSPT